MSNNDDIIDTVDSWNQDQIKAKREAENMKHERIMSRWGFFKKVFLWTTSITAVGTFVLWVHSCVVEKNSLEEAETSIKENRFRKSYNAGKEGMVECVSAIGLKKCRSIQVMFLLECQMSNYRSNCLDTKISLLSNITDD